MSIAIAARLIAAAGVLSVGAAGASATLYNWAFTPGMPGSYGLSNAGGTIHSVFTTFDTTSKQLTYTINFSDRVTQGYWLALNNGPNPKNHPGELGLFYFDASDVFDLDATTNIRLTAYGYNGENGPNSWQDGNPGVAGNQPGDLIKGINNTAWIQAISAGDVVLPGGVNGRRLSMTIDATDIISHTPLYPDAVDPWYGTGFDSSLGIWCHPVTAFTAGYSNTTGGITSLSLGNQGWLDGDHFRTDLIPAPGAGALAGAGALLLGRRRRRA